MTLPANVRVNVGIAFPGRVQGSGPVTVSKASGIWTFGFSFTGIATQVPPFANYGTDLILFYDSVAKSFFTMSISTLVASVGSANARAQRSVNASPIAIAAGDQIINCGINAVASCALPTAASRSGVPLTFKDIGFAAANNITISPHAGDTILGANSGSNFVINTNLQELTLVPFNDGTNTGWYVG